MKKLVIKRAFVLGRWFKLKLKKVEGDGLCCPSTETISINPEAENIDRSIVHELTHALIFSGGLYEALKGNEELIEVFCEQNARVITENFKLMPKD